MYLTECLINLPIEEILVSGNWTWLYCWCCLICTPSLGLENMWKLNYPLIGWKVEYEVPVAIKLCTLFRDGSTSTLETDKISTEEGNDLVSCAGWWQPVPVCTSRRADVDSVQDSAGEADSRGRKEQTAGLPARTLVLLLLTTITFQQLGQGDA